MNKNFILILLLFIYPGIHSLNAQDLFSRIIYETSNGEAPFPEAGLTKQGVVNALLIFIEFPDSNQDVNNPTWPVGIGPNYLKDIIDSSETQHSNKHFNLTTYFDTMSSGKFKIIGKAYYKQAPHLLSEYATMHPDSECHYVTKDVVELLDSEIDFSDYDKWTNNENGIQPGADGNLDMVIVCFRHWYLNHKISSFWTTGWIPLSVPGFIKVDNRARNIITGVDVLDMINYPTMFEIVLHEIGHHWGLVHNYTGGVWSVMGRKNISFCMNSLEKEKLGWMNKIVDIDMDNEIHMIPDYVTTGISCRIKALGTTYYFENHQLLSQYDGVDKTGSPGLYILQMNPNIGEQNPLSLVNADGKWNWSVPYWIPNPWGDNTSAERGDIIPVFKREALNRISGITDRGLVYSLKNPASIYSPPYPILTWIDEQSGQIMYDMQPISRSKGDGKDRYTLTENNVFSPWSASAAYAQDGKPTTIGAEIVGESGNNIIVKFYVTNPENISPSKPQNVHAFFQGPNTVKVYWTPNIEPNMTNGSGYGYDVYRAVYSRGDPLNYTKINSSLVMVSSFIDVSVPSRPPADTVYLRYQIKAYDNTGKQSVMSEDGWLNMDMAIGSFNVVTLNAASYFVPGNGATYNIDSINVGPSWVGTIPSGLSIRIEAISPSNEWQFVTWSDSLKQNPRTLTPTSDVILNAVFRKKNLYTITINESNSIESNGGTYEVMHSYVGTSWNKSLFEGDSIEIKAVPIGGRFFIGWSDGDTSNPRSIIASRNLTISAVYKMHLGSTISTATSSNGQRKLVRDPRGVLHAVYESGGEIWYIESADNGTTWSKEKNLSNSSNGGGVCNRNPSLSYYVPEFLSGVNSLPSAKTGQSVIQGFGGYYPRQTRSVVSWEVRSDTCSNYKIAVRWVSVDGSYWENTSFIPSNMYYTSSSYANPSVSYPYIFFHGPDGIYFTKSIENSMKILGFSDPPVKINGTTSNSKNLSTISRPSESYSDTVHIVWEENNEIKYCHSYYGLISSVETVAASDSLEANTYPCITTSPRSDYQDWYDVWIAWQYRNNTNSFEAIRTRIRRSNSFGSIFTFHIDDSLSTSISHRKPVITGYSGASVEGFHYPYDTVSLLWHYNDKSIKKILNFNGVWGSIETLENNVSEPQLSVDDGYWSSPRVALFSSLQGPQYSIISYPFYTCPSIIISVNEGWNFVSVPCAPKNYNASVLFPNCFGDIFAFDATTGMYKPAPNLAVGPGYWASYLSASSESISGVPIVGPIQVACQNGWNLIGSREVPILTSTLSTIPQGKIFGDLFDYVSGNYVTTNVIIPGKGAWVYVTGTCTLVIP